jgi:glycosyltransferase involved in cell wall biosynthesis
MSGIGNGFSPVFATGEDGQIIRRLKALGIQSYILGNKGFLGLRYIAGFIRIIRSEKVDALHLNTLTSFCKYAGIAGFILRRPILWVVRENPLISRSRRLRFWLKILSSKIVFVDRDTRNKLLPRTFKGVEVIYNGIDLGTFRPFQSKFLYDTFHIDHDQRLIGFIGLITKRKGLEYLLRAISLVRKRLEKVKLAVIGGYKENEKEYYNNIRELTKDLSLENDVIFTGMLSDIQQVCNSLDIVILPSLEERCSRTLLESLACAKPVVATNVGGTPEIIDNRVNGILVDPEDEHQIAEAVIELLGNDQLRADLGKKGRIKAEQEFDIKNHINGMKKLYQGFSREL